MQNNRLLKISTAGSRKAAHWQENTILWSEFVEKLENAGTQHGNHGGIPCHAEEPAGGA